MLDFYGSVDLEMLLLMNDLDDVQTFLLRWDAGRKEGLKLKVYIFHS